MSTVKVEEIQHPSNSNNAVSIASDSSVSLKHSGSAKLTTTSTGVSVTGACAATSVTATSVTGTSVEDSKGNVRIIPKNSQSSSYTLVATDSGKHIFISSGGVTIPASIFDAGDAITIINNSGSDQTITCSAITTYLANDTTAKSSLTLKGRGVCTFIFVGTGMCYGAGAGLE